MKLGFWGGSILSVVAVCMLVGCDVQIGEPDATSAPAESRLGFQDKQQPRPAPCPKPCPDGRCPTAYDVPPVDLPVEFREANYKNGSCMHAAVITVLRGQRQYRVADYWRRHYWGGANVSDIVPIAEGFGLRFAYTINGDEKFLDWCSRTRRGAAIHWRVSSPSDHAITFCGYEDSGNAVLIDNNSPGRLKRMSRRAFLAEWHLSGGKAFTVVYRPPPPRPWIVWNRR